MPADIAMLTYGGKLKQKEKDFRTFGRHSQPALYPVRPCCADSSTTRARPPTSRFLPGPSFDAIYKIQHAMRGVIDNYPFGPGMRPVRDPFADGFYPSAEFPAGAERRTLRPMIVWATRLLPCCSRPRKPAIA